MRRSKRTPAAARRVSRLSMWRDTGFCLANRFSAKKALNTGMVTTCWAIISRASASVNDGMAVSAMARAKPTRASRTSGLSAASASRWRRTRRHTSAVRRPHDGQYCRSPTNSTTADATFWASTSSRANCCCTASAPS